jgi:hypothetical protein
MSAGGQLSCPPAGSSSDRHRAVQLAATGQFLLAIDTVPSRALGGGRIDRRRRVRDRRAPGWSTASPGTTVKCRWPCSTHTTKQSACSIKRLGAGAPIMAAPPRHWNAAGRSNLGRLRGRTWSDGGVPETPRSRTRPVAEMRLSLSWVRAPGDSPTCWSQQALCRPRPASCFHCS